MQVPVGATAACNLARLSGALYDTNVVGDDAEFEACMPVRQAKSIDGIAVRQLPAGRCVALLHKGPYDQLGRSYARVLKGFSPLSAAGPLTLRERLQRGHTGTHT